MFTKFDNMQSNSFFIPSMLKTAYLESQVGVSDDYSFGNLIVNASFNKIDGTFIYVIDSQNNQFIVSLKDNPPKIQVIYRGFNIRISLTELCNCKNKCKQEMLSLQFNIKKDVEIQCNSNKLFKLAYENNRIKYPGFPIPVMNGNQARIWLVNIPLSYGGSSDPDQMVGCVVAVASKGRLVGMKPNLPKEIRACKTVCGESLCTKSGICHETYSQTNPKCDCTKAFGFGDRCNDPLKSYNKKYSIKNIIGVYSMKLIWTYESRFDISIDNKITIKRSDAALTVSYKSDPLTNEIKYNVEINSTNHKQYLMFTLDNKDLLVEYSSNQYVQKISLKNEADFVNLVSGKFNFESETSAEFVMAYKSNSDELKWHKIPLELSQTNTNTNNKADERPDINNKTRVKECVSLLTRMSCSNESFNANVSCPIASQNRDIKSAQASNSMIICLISLGILICVIVVLIVVITNLRKKLRAAIGKNMEDRYNLSANLKSLYPPNVECESVKTKIMAPENNI